MTTPIPDDSGQIAPGYYHADGDPDGTVRHWDGGQWVGEPMAPPPGWGGDTAANFDRGRYGTVGIRIGAALLDVVFFVVISLVIGGILAAAGAIDTTGDAATRTSVNAASIVFLIVAIAIQVGFIRMLGGTPGKLVLGLRITDADSVTTPPSMRNSAMRVIPIAVVTQIPLVGFLASIAILVMCIVWVNGDAERRSVYDRVGDTRVVYKNVL